MQTIPNTNASKHFLLAILIGLVTGFTMTYVMLLPSRYFSQMTDLSDPIRDSGTHSKDEVFHRMEDSAVADQLSQRIRILCWVMTEPKHHKIRAWHVKNTWGKCCNVLLFMSSKQDASLPAIALPVKEGPNNAWAKTKEAFKYVYKHYRDKVDWILKADDDTYVILENLRFMLMKHNPSDPVYFGCRFKVFVKQGYMSGGAGYVLSHEALKRFIEVGLPNSTLCSDVNSDNEDIEMGKCMEGVKVTAGDSRDTMGRGRFFPFTPEHHIIPGHTKDTAWYWMYTYYKNKEGMECCSDNAVSFHYIRPYYMYTLEYFIYHLKPYGISYQMEMPSGVDTQSFSIHAK